MKKKLVYAFIATLLMLSTLVLTVSPLRETTGTQLSAPNISSGDNEAGVLGGYDVAVVALSYDYGLDVNVGIAMDGNPTGYVTPHIFVSLVGTHTFTVPSVDPVGRSFKRWNTGSTNTAITISGGGTFTAYYPDDWPTFRHDQNHTGYSTSTGPDGDTNDTAWSYDTNGILQSSPTVAEGQVFVTTLQGNVTCLDAFHGTWIWSYTTPTAIVSSPAVAEGRVYFGSSLNVTCVNATDGSFIWNYTTNGSVDSSPVVVDNRVYVGSSDHNVTCLNASDGSWIWNYTTDGFIQDSSPAVAGGRVYFGSNDGNVTCLNASDGSWIWNYTTGDLGPFSPAIKDDRIYVGSRHGYFYCLRTADGSQIWNRSIDTSSSPAIFEGKTYFGSDDGNVTCLNASDGSFVWNYATGGEVVSSPAIAEGKVYVGSYDTNLYCLNASDGSLIWNYSAGAPIYSSPAISAGHVYIGMGTSIYAFGSYCVTIQAYCYSESLDLNVAIQMDGSSTGYDTPHKFPRLKVVHTFTVPNVDSNGHFFKNWSTGETNPTITVESRGARKLTYVAYYQAKHDLKITSNGHGTTNPDSGTYSYWEGTAVTVTAVPDQGYYLDHWDLDSVNIGPKNPRKVTMDKDHNLSAVFEAYEPGSAPPLPCAPPVDTSTYHVGTVGQPRNVDPTRGYDTASGELIMNVYDSLIGFADKPTMPAETSKVNVSNLANLADFKPVLCTALPTLQVVQGSGSNWTFHIDTSRVFQDWTDSLGVVHSEQHLTADDVVYNFQRQFVQDQSGSPQWLFLQPAYGLSYFSKYDQNKATNTIDPIGNDAAGERVVAAKIQKYVTASGDDVTFHFLNDWPLGGLYQTFANTFGCIPPKNFCIEHGCWDGTWTDGWSTIWRRKPSSSQTPLDSHYSPYSKYSSASAEPAMCGTGPYAFTYWDKAKSEWRIDKFAGYWGGWAGAHVNRVVETGIGSWQTRKMVFMSGGFDEAVVPRANMWDLLDPSDPTGGTPIPGMILYYGMPLLSNKAMAFCFDVAPDSPYQTKFYGVPAHDFFNNTHIRQAFAHSINFAAYLSSAWFNEAIHPASWYVIGLSPDYRNKTLVPHDIDLAKVQSELTAAGVWNKGFETTLVYMLGNEEMRIACEMVNQTFSSLGQRFKCNIVGLDRPVFLAYQEQHFMPVSFVEWQADFADPDNFARPYMYSEGDIAYCQGYNDMQVDALIDYGAFTFNGQSRNDTYQTLQYIYWRDVPSLPLVQTVGRRWQRDWVRGWYCNQLYPGNYYYDLYKVVGAGWDVDLVVQSITPMVFYPRVLVYHGEMRVGNGSQERVMMTYTVSVKRNDNNWVIPLLYAAVGLGISNATGYFQYPNATYVILAPGGTANVTFDWFADGLEQVMTNGTWGVGATTWPIASVGAFVSNAWDTNGTNNGLADGKVRAQTLLGDINGNGKVDIYDAILLSNSFNKKSTDKGFNPDADLKPDNVIDIYDAILLANNYNTHVP